MAEYSLYLTSRMSELITISSCTEQVLRACLSEGIISGEETNVLENVTTKQKQNSMFWDIIITRSEVLQKLVSIFGKQNQNTVVQILERAVRNEISGPEETPPQANASQQQGAPRVTQKQNLKHVVNPCGYKFQSVLATLEVELKRVLSNVNQNDLIISILYAKELVDLSQLATIRENDRRVYITESQRIAALVRLFENKPDKVITEFLNMIIDLPENENTSTHIREFLNSKFPGLILSTQANSK